jgi:hypothetical protein
MVCLSMLWVLNHNLCDASNSQKKGSQLSGEVCEEHQWISTRGVRVRRGRCECGCRWAARLISHLLSASGAEGSARRQRVVQEERD